MNQILCQDEEEDGNNSKFRFDHHVNQNQYFALAAVVVLPRALLGALHAPFHID